MNGVDVFYYARFLGIFDCYFCPLNDNELIPRDCICKFFIDLLTPLTAVLCKSFPIKIYFFEKYTREELMKINKYARDEKE